MNRSRRHPPCRPGARRGPSRSRTDWWIALGHRAFWRPRRWGERGCSRLGRRTGYPPIRSRALAAAAFGGVYRRGRPTMQHRTHRILRRWRDPGNAAGPGGPRRSRHPLKEVLAACACDLKSRARVLNVPTTRLVSWAGHDAGVFGQIIRAAMIFLPVRRELAMPPKNTPATRFLLTEPGCWPKLPWPYQSAPESP